MNKRKVILITVMILTTMLATVSVNAMSSDYSN